MHKLLQFSLKPTPWFKSRSNPHQIMVLGRPETIAIATLLPKTWWEENDFANLDIGWHRMTYDDIVTLGSQPLLGIFQLGFMTFCFGRILINHPMFLAVSDVGCCIPPCHLYIYIDIYIVSLVEVRFCCLLGNASQLFFTCNNHILTSCISNVWRVQHLWCLGLMQLDYPDSPHVQLTIAIEHAPLLGHFQTRKPPVSIAF
jgi:hypothetical protein